MSISPSTDLTTAVPTSLYLVVFASISHKDSRLQIHLIIKLLTHRAIGRMVQSTTRVRHREPRMLQRLTNSVQRPTKALSTQVFVPSIGLASRVANGRRAASHSRVSLVLSGRFHAGQHHQRSGLKVPRETLHQGTAAKRTRTTASWRVRRARRAMVALTSNLAARLATTPAHQHHQPFRPRPHQRHPPLLLPHKHWRLSYWVIAPRLVLRHSGHRLISYPHLLFGG